MNCEKNRTGSGGGHKINIKNKKKEIVERVGKTDAIQNLPPSTTTTTSTITTTTNGEKSQHAKLIIIFLFFLLYLLYFPFSFLILIIFLASFYSTLTRFFSMFILNYNDYCCASADRKVDCKNVEVNAYNRTLKMKIKKKGMLILWFLANEIKKKEFIVVDYEGNRKFQ